MDKKVCFIIMGFGKKKDPDTNRTIDLDATYKKLFALRLKHQVVSVFVPMKL